MSEVVVSGIRQDEEAIFCPDCEAWIAGSRDAFIAHRQAEHVGLARTLAASGIRSQEAHGYQDPPPSKEE